MATFRLILSKFYTLKASLSRKTLRVIDFALHVAAMDWVRMVKHLKYESTGYQTLQIRFMKYLVDSRTKQEFKEKYRRGQSWKWYLQPGNFFCLEFKNKNVGSAFLQKQIKSSNRVIQE